MINTIFTIFSIIFRVNVVHVFVFINCTELYLKWVCVVVNAAARM